MKNKTKNARLSSVLDYRDLWQSNSYINDVYIEENNRKNLEFKSKLMENKINYIKTEENRLKIKNNIYLKRLVKRIYVQNLKEERITQVYFFLFI